MLQHEFLNLKMRVLKNTKEIIKIILQKKLKMKKEKPQQVTRQNNFINLN